MATTIATLTTKADGSMEGVFATLRVNAPITVVPNPNKASEEAPDYRILNKRTGFEIGAGWNRRSLRSGEEYVSVKIEAPEKAMRQQVSSAIDVVIQVTRYSDGARRLSSISEIVGMEGDVITMQEIFLYERQGIDEDGKVLGRFRATGIRPRFAERLSASGIDLSTALFSNADFGFAGGVER